MTDAEIIEGLTTRVANLQNAYDNLVSQYKAASETDYMKITKMEYIIGQYRKRYKWLNWLFYPEEKGK